MKTDINPYVDELVRLAGEIDRPVQLMEVCGTHTVSIFRHGLRSMLPANVNLISGPGCPVCVTAQRHIDAAIELSRVPGAIIATYGDMVRVPGQQSSLEQRRAAGADVRVVGSTMTAVKLARENPDRPVVFLAVGFETTAPATAAAILDAEQRGLQNFFVLAAHKLVVPAMLALLQDGDVPLDGFLCPGHVSVIIGSDAYRPVVAQHRMPCVVGGFEPAGILAALVGLLRQVREGDARLENPYDVAVSRSGNPLAYRLLEQVFEPEDTVWRALGEIPGSGLALRPAFGHFDALGRFGITLGDDHDHPACRCGEVIQGKTTPDQCALFGTACTPMQPYGPCMVSSEGTCSAWFKYNRHTKVTNHGPAASGVEQPVRVESGGTRS